MHYSCLYASKNIKLIIAFIFELFLKRKTEVRWRVQREALAEQSWVKSRAHFRSPKEILIILFTH